VIHIKVKIKSSGNVKKKENKMLVIILRENRTALFSWEDNRKEEFSIRKHTYFTDSKGSYIHPSGFVVAIYLEGASLPVHHGCLKYKKLKKQKVRRINPFSGKEEDYVIPERTIIETVKYDSGLIDMLLNRRLADVFTRVHVDLPNLLLTILLVGTLAVGIVNVGLHFM